MLATPDLHIEPRLADDRGFLRIKGGQIAILNTVFAAGAIDHSSYCRPSNPPPLREVES